MNAKRVVLAALAAMLAVAAIVVGAMGYRMSTGKSTAGTDGKTVAPTFRVVVATRDLEAGAVVQASDVTVRTQDTLPANVYSEPGQIIGKKLRVAVKADKAVPLGGIEEMRSIAEKLNLGERAVAVQVDKVSGVGGFIQPGDRVDVLLYLRRETETDEKTTAQVVMRDVRLLTFENNTGEAPPPGETERDRQTRQERNPTAVLAVPELDVSRLMLAANSGTLRLALRPEAPPENVLAALPPAVEAGAPAAPATQPGAAQPAAAAATAGSTAPAAAPVAGAAQPRPAAAPASAAATQAQKTAPPAATAGAAQPAARPAPSAATAPAPVLRPTAAPAAAPVMTAQAAPAVRPGKVDPVAEAARAAQLVTLSELAFAQTKPQAAPGQRTATPQRVVVTNKVEVFEGEKSRTVTVPAR